MSFGALGKTCVSHVHELEWWLGYRTSAPDLGFTKDVTDHYIACSRVTSESLVSTQGVPPERITLCHAFVGIDEVQLVRARADRHVTRRRLGISPDALVVGGVGTMDWRKGPDLFVQLAAMVTRRLPDQDVHFVWAGGDAAGPTRGGLVMDARRLGLGDRIRFVGPLEHLAELFAAMDVFALTSREDPFPLVMLEAAAAGVPLVCFAGGGGAPEFAHPDAGRVAAYLDVAGMATAVSDLLEREEERQRMGQIAADRVRKRHTVDQAGPVVVDVIRRSLGSDRGAASLTVDDDPLLGLKSSRRSNNFSSGGISELLGYHSMPSRAGCRPAHVEGEDTLFRGRADSRPKRPAPATSGHRRSMP